MGKRRLGICSFCGTSGIVSREHVVPLGLFAPSIHGSCRFVLIPSCDQCNGAFSKHEDHFRTFCTVASQGTPEAKELFYDPIRRAFDRPVHGVKSLKRLYAGMKESVDQPGRRRIYPNEDVFFILRKIIRGLAFKHLRKVAVSDADVDVRVLLFEIPDEFNRAELFNAVHPTVFQYRFDLCDDGDYQSLWLLKIFETVRFVGAIRQQKK